MIETPERYRRFLEKYGGLNRLGEPNFILHWGGDPVRRLAVPEQFLAPYLNCWCLAEWVPPEEIGSPETWESWMGPYPDRGCYIPVQVFKEDNKPVMLDSEFLNLNVLALFLKVILHHKSDSLSKRYYTLKNEHDRVEANKVKELVDLIEDGAPAFSDAVSFSGQKNVNSIVKQKMDLIEKNMDRVRDFANRIPRGISTLQPKGVVCQMPEQS